MLNLRIETINKKKKHFMNFIKPKYEHKDDLWLWNVIAHEEAVWSTWGGLEFAYYYFVQHKLFKRMKRIKCFGYRPKEHDKYEEFCQKHLTK